MKKSILASVLVVVAAVCVFAAPRGPRITLKNSTGYEVRELFVSPADSEDWGSDYLVNTTLDDGDSFIITLPKPLSEERIYDIMCVDIEDDRYCQFEVAITEGKIIEMTLDDLYDDSEDENAG